MWPCWCGSSVMNPTVRSPSVQTLTAHLSPRESLWWHWWCPHRSLVLWTWCCDESWINPQAVRVKVVICRSQKYCPSRQLSWGNQSYVEVYDTLSRAYYYVICYLLYIHDSSEPRCDIYSFPQQLCASLVPSAGCSVVIPKQWGSEWDVLTP